MHLKFSSANKLIKSCAQTDSKSAGLVSQTISSHKSFIIHLLKREIIDTFSRSHIGILWILISPITGIMSWSILHSFRLLQPGPLAVPYIAYILVGSQLWGYFMSIYTAIISIPSKYRIFLWQSTYGLNIFIIAQVMLSSLYFSISFIVILIALYIADIPLNYLLVFTPLCCIPLILLAYCLGLCSLVMSLISHDMHRLFGSMVGLLFFISPVLYASNTPYTSTFQQVCIQYNPMTYFLELCRSCIFNIPFNQLTPWCISFMCVLVCYGLMQYTTVHLTPLLKERLYS